MRSLASTAWLFLLAAGVLLPAGCAGNADYRPEAIGPNAEVTVVVDSSRWNGPVGTALREELASPIQTLPVPEPFFDLRQMDLTPESLDRVQRFSNVIVAAALRDSSYEAQFLRRQFSEKAKQALRRDSGGVVIPRPQEWRRKQQVYYLAAATPQALVQTIHRNGKAIRDSINLATRRRTYADMFEKGRQTDIEDALMSKHGFAVNAQHDYQIVQDTTVADSTGRSGFVLLVRALPDTWRRLFIYYEENAAPSRLSSEWLYQTRDSLAQQYLQGGQCGYAKIDRRSLRERSYLQTERITFLDRYAYETRGLWYFAEKVRGDTTANKPSEAENPAENPEDTTGAGDTEYQMCGGGGPLLNYAFYDRAQDRLYIIDGMVFAPSYDKREFLRQLEVIAHTFRTRPEVQSQKGEESVAQADP